MPVLDGSRVVAALRGAFARSVTREELLRTAAEKIRASGAPYTSVYLYMLHGTELVLEAFAGRKTDHTRIPVGVGVCGTAVASGLDQNVPDVTVWGTTSRATAGPVPSWWCSFAGARRYWARSTLTVTSRIPSRRMKRLR